LSPASLEWRGLFLGIIIKELYAMVSFVGKKFIYKKQFYYRERRQMTCGSKDLVTTGLLGPPETFHVTCSSGCIVRIWFNKLSIMLLSCDILFYLLKVIIGNGLCGSVLHEGRAQCVALLAQVVPMSGWAWHELSWFSQGRDRRSRWEKCVSVRALARIGCVPGLVRC